MNLVKEHKIRCSGAVQLAVKRGFLKRLSCEVCDEEYKTRLRTAAHAHHPDYNEPLSVEFLCGTHHSEWHKNHQAEPPHENILRMNVCDLLNIGLQQLGFKPLASNICISCLSTYLIDTTFTPLCPKCMVARGFVPRIKQRFTRF